MRIVYVYESLSKKGGTEKMLTQKMNWLADNCGYDVYIITNHQNNEANVFPLSDKVTHIDIDVQLWKKYNYKYPYRLWIEHKLYKLYAEKLLASLKQINPDIIICCHSYNPGLICALPIKTPKIVEVHNPRDEITFKGNFFSFQLEKIKWRKELAKAERNCDTIVTLTSGDATSWKIAKCVEVIPNMVVPFNKSDYPIQSKKVVSFGRLVSQKGYDLLIKAWHEVYALHPDWSLDIYGEGEEYLTLQQLILNFGLDKVVKINPFTNKVERILSECSFLVCSSRYEGFGLTLVEAMTAGRPCVSFDCPYGPSDIITDHFDGLLASSSNIMKLSEAISNMIDNEVLRQKLASNAVVSAKRYHPDYIMPKWVSLFEELVKGSSPINIT